VSWGAGLPPCPVVLFNGGLEAFPLNSLDWMRAGSVRFDPPLYLAKHPNQRTDGRQRENEKKCSRENQKEDSEHIIKKHLYNPTERGRRLQASILDLRLATFD
jgi:hypothetical protein